VDRRLAESLFEMSWLRRPLYDRWGDWFAWLNVSGLIVLMLSRANVWKREAEQMIQSLAVLLAGECVWLLRGRSHV